MKKPILAALALCYALGAAAQTPDTAAPEGYRFTDVKILPVTPVKDQSRSGTCWCYSTLSFFESEILRAGGPELDLSEMWIVRNIYFEKAVKYVRLHGSLNLAVGGQAHDVLHGIEAYGIVPEEVYPGLNYGYDKPNFDEIDAVIKAYADAVIKAGGKRSDSRLTTAWQAGLNGILDAYFGPMPGKFTYRGREYTPASFAASLPIDLGDYIEFTSFTHHPLHGVRHGGSRQLELGQGMERAPGRVHADHRQLTGEGLHDLLGNRREREGVQPHQRSGHRP